MDIQIITPPVADETDALDHGLVTLTEAVCQATGEESDFGLGGRFGYGENFENDVFMMHRFCWCESEHCRWCSEDACGCPHPHPRYYLDDKQIDDWGKANDTIVAPLPWKIAKRGSPEYKAASRAFDKSIKERDRRLKTVWPARIHTCEPKGMMADRAEGDTWKPSQSAPNFWHKKSGLKVWWHLWIGRDMEVIGSAGANLQEIFAECVASLSRGSEQPR